MRPMAVIRLNIVVDKIPLNVTEHDIYDAGMEIIENNRSAISSNYLRMAQDANLSGLSFVGRHASLEGGRMRYSNNYGQEIVDLTVYPALDQQVVRGVAIPAGVPVSFLVVTYTWGGARDLDTLTNIEVPDVADYVGYGFERVLSYRDKQIATWSGDDTSDNGNETIEINIGQIVTLSKARQVQIHTAAWWFAGTAGSANLAVELYNKAGKRIYNKTFSPSVTRVRDTENGDSMPSPDILQPVADITVTVSRFAATVNVQMLA